MTAGPPPDGSLPPDGSSAEHAGLPSAGAIAVAILNGTLTVLYPVAIWLGLTRLGTRATGVIVLGLLVPLVAFRLRRADRATFWSVLRVPIAILALIVLGIVTDDARFVLALPVLISAVLLLTFAVTLRPGQVPMIERFARLTEPDLSPDKQAHCRRWTIRWCLFFVINGAIAATLALTATTFVWASYTGGFAYALMGMLFAAELIERRYRFRDFGRGPLDRLLRWALPAPRTPREHRGDRSSSAPRRSTIDAMSEIGVSDGGVRGTLELPAVDLISSLRFHRVGMTDPSVWTDAHRYAVAFHTDAGPATLLLTAHDRTRIELSIDGPGARSVEPRVPAICGAHDAPEDVLPLVVGLPRLHDLLRRQKLVRLSRVPWVYETTLGTVMQQRVDFPAAAQSWALLLKRWGARAPGALGLTLAPRPEVVLAIPSHDFRSIGVDGQRERAIKAACRAWPRFDPAATLPDARRFLASIDGLGPWTVESIAAIAYGDPDAVPTGDFWLPHLVANAMIGKARATDEEMLALLEPYRPHRQRVIRALYAGGFSVQRFGPHRPRGPGDVGRGGMRRWSRA